MTSLALLIGGAASAALGAQPSDAAAQAFVAGGLAPEQIRTRSTMSGDSPISSSWSSVTWPC